jgi:acyl-coenzyme A thioesterase PaaI-like protein
MNMHDVVREQMAHVLPFLKLTGVEIVELTPSGGVARLNERAEVLNHIGTVHAGAVFTLGEAASGAAMTGIFADVIQSIRPVAAEARITYSKLARGTLTARGSIGEPAEALRSRFDAESRVAFEVNVDIKDLRGHSVASMVVAWNVRKA